MQIMYDDNFTHHATIPFPQDWDLFGKRYPKCKMETHEQSGKYVSDSITEERIDEWVKSSCNAGLAGKSYSEHPYEDGLSPSQKQYPQPVALEAPTGKGKNHFLNYTLREYAYKHNKKILCVGNRNALDRQQKKDLDELSLVRLYPEKYEYSEGMCTYGNITLITYQALAEKILDPDWNPKFDFVVLDECHFFYSDALFNPNTWFLLENIVKKFAFSVRIYMSATFENVFEVIRYMEGSAVRLMGSNRYKRSMYHYVDHNFKYYRFAGDFSKYNICFFSDTPASGKRSTKDDGEKSNSPLLKRICSSKRDKSIIFVTSKEKGKKLKAEIENILARNNENAADAVSYIDKGSRKQDGKEKLDWEYLLENGKIPERILITTSVIDNGFSIKDKMLKNIVIYTDDQTEFMQELGRCRLEEGDTVNLYIKKTSPSDISRLTNKYNSYYSVVARCCKDEPHLLNPDIHSILPVNEKACFYSLWNCEADERRAFFRLAAVTNERTYKTDIEPVFNKMVCWCLRKIGETILRYKEYEENYGVDAGKLFKLHWLFPDAESSDEYEDLDSTQKEELVNSLKELLGNIESKEIAADSTEYKAFIEKFRTLYISLCGSKDINRSEKQKYWTHVAMTKRLEKLRDYGINYKISNSKNTYIITPANAQ